MERPLVRLDIDLHARRSEKNLTFSTVPENARRLGVKSTFLDLLLYLDDLACREKDPLLGITTCSGRLEGCIIVS